MLVENTLMQKIMMSAIFYHFYYYVDALFLQMYFEFFW